MPGRASRHRRIELIAGTSARPARRHRPIDVQDASQKHRLLLEALSLQDRWGSSPAGEGETREVPQVCAKPPLTTITGALTEKMSGI